MRFSILVGTIIVGLFKNNEERNLKNQETERKLQTTLALKNSLC